VRDPDIVVGAFRIARQTQHCVAVRKQAMCGRMQDLIVERIANRFSAR
jgi:hypothetical protein